jgi:proteasome lid subunit RPN8/RPN11
LVRLIEDHARETFPEECCGFLIGAIGDVRRIDEARRAANVVQGNRRQRYVIDPRETLTVEKSLADSGREILGFYHSHPNHPAIPSEFDRGHAWPWYSYIILSIVDREPADLRAWTLDGETSTFGPDELRVEP